MVKVNYTLLPDPSGYITFDDIFAIALAKTKSNKFVADSDKWQRVLYDVHQKYQDKIPELTSIFFNESRTALSPQTDAFYELLNILSASKLISLPNPSYEYIVMDAEQKERVINLENYVLIRYKEHITEIADMLERALSE